MWDYIPLKGKKLAYFVNNEGSFKVDKPLHDFWS